MKGVKMRDIMQNRYSCRNFKDEKINENIIRDIIDLTRFTPSSLALEPWKFMVVSGEQLKTLGEICLYQPQVLNCSHAIIVIARDDIKRGDIFLKERVFSKGKEDSKALAFMERIAQKTENMSTQELACYTNSQCYMAIANLVNIAYSLDVKSCIVGGFEYDKLLSFIDMPSQFRPCMVIALGLSDEPSTPKTRQSLDEVIIYKR